MTTAAAQARHLSLARLERAAGQAFGCPEEADKAPAPRAGLFTPATTITLATLATALAATITYLV